MDKHQKALKLRELEQRVNLIFSDTDCDAVIDKALQLGQDNIIDNILESGLRGRGGAGFPTGIKWRAAKEAQSDVKYVICNADEGEPGTFKDRKILDEKADKVFAGMAICAIAIGAREGFIYLRGEYNFLRKDLTDQIDKFQDLFQQKGLNFTIRLISGSGAYICGEETSLLESMEGKRGEPRNKPPFPVTEGYMNKPTVINNVETFAYTTTILNEGPGKFKNIGTKDSKGSKVFSVSGDADVEGIYELPLGMTIAEFVEIFGDGDTKAVQVGGSSGFCVPRKNFEETIISFEGTPTGGSMMLFNSSRSMYRVLTNFLEFFEEESCGQCTPCRVGCQQLLKGIKAIRSGGKESAFIEDLIDLAETMKISSKCGLGQSVANPFISIVKNFREEITY
jgi:[NiFe] hydrogenase diaphorase moiety large subunit